MSIEHLRSSLTVADLAAARSAYATERLAIDSERADLSKLQSTGSWTYEHDVLSSRLRKREVLAEARFGLAVSQLIVARAEAALR